ncbi:MAG: GNAT family N-acetyltransferase [Crocinitomicaceae bacterium]|nr:GNAT family N-acetyltransferase [Crocinitomicaceae bacterium]
MILQTERLILQKFTEADAPFILELLNSEGWIKYIGDRKVYSLEDAKKYLINGPIKSYSENGFGLSKVELKSNHTPIGMCGLIKRAGLDDVDLGFAFLPQFTRQGFAFEIADACLYYAFHVLKLNRVVAITLPENVTSVKLLSKLGMKEEKKITLPNDSALLSLYGTVLRSTTHPPFIEFPILKTDRILLREIQLEEAASILEILFYNQKAAANVDEAINILKKIDLNYRDGSGVNWGIVIPETNEIAGTIGFYRGFENDTGEIGFVTKEKFRRKGYTLEAILRLVNFGYHEMELKKIIAFTNPENFASQNLLKGAGFISDLEVNKGYLEFAHTQIK